MTFRTSILTALMLAAAPAAAQPPEKPNGGEHQPASLQDDISDEELLELAGEPEVIEIIEAAPPGSAHAVTEEQLERFEHDDIHKVLAAVPGVYIREEDGYGLRPNIGMRGSGSERSSKIALMEDGVLIAPAPYAAPAAYYFPLVTRMSLVEVVKGPSAIRHGPNTVGGALNLITRPIPAQTEATVDVAGGSDLYGKLHASYGDSTEHFGWLIEGVTLHSDGFKQLDGTDGGDTGFDKNDVMLKLRANTSPAAQLYHQLDLKLSYADESSNETYTGLTLGDFADNPYRRYAATALDRMEWDHTTVQLSHLLRAPGGFTLTTVGYRNDFTRAWRKLNGFDTTTALDAILANPTGGNNAVFYAVLTGQADSSSDPEMLLIGTNHREFVSQGVQTVGRLQRGWLGVEHDLQIGVRLHYDEALRLHDEESYAMVGGQLVDNPEEPAITRNATDSALALASFVQEKARLGDVTVTAGLRTELIDTESRDHMTGAVARDQAAFVLIPGAGVVYQPLPTLGLLAGVHKGFVPVAPGGGGDVDPEESINYELGARWADVWANAEVIGFFSDYSNLKGTCTFSSGCMDEQVGDEFNGGAAHVWGVEAIAGSTIPLWRTLGVPLRATYTFNHATFQSSFTSDNPQWGDVREGDQVPYLPEHQLSAQAGIAGQAWEAVAAVRHTSAMRNVAGQGDIADPYEQTDAITVLDLAASYDFGAWGKAYATVDNALDQAHIVSLRPYGARPGVPRLFIFGYKNTF